MAGPTEGLVLTPARWSTWVGQRHEWNGYLWIRWADAEAVLLFVSGRPRIHLWEAGGWAEGEHALTTISQRLDRLPPPRWGQVALPARWAAALRDLSLVHPAVPVELVAPEEWIAWVRRTGFTGLAVLVGDVAAAWIAQDGNVRALRFQQGAVMADDRGTAGADGVLQIYRGRVAIDLSPVIDVPLPPERSIPAAPVEPSAADVPAEIVLPAAASPPVQPPEAVPPPAAAPAIQIPAAEVPAPAAQISPPAPAESGETTVVSAGSEMTRRFRGDERFLLAPTVDLVNPETLLDVISEHGEDILGWLPLLDGSHTLEEVARAGLVPLSVVDAVVAALAARRMVFRYTARPRASSRSP